MKHRLPTLPGEILKTEFLEQLNLSQVDFVKHLGRSWTQPKLSAIVNGKKQITVDIALDFAEVFETSPQFWMNLQANYDLAVAKKKRRRVRGSLVKRSRKPRSLSKGRP